MPELPEVETIAAILRNGTPDQPSLRGMVISNARVLWARTLVTPSVAEFEQRLPGQLVKDIWRRGKHLALSLSQHDLIFHLRMSGDLLVERQDTPLAPHHRLLIDFTGGYRLAFNDTRKFGRVWLTSEPDKLFASLGPEPLDENFQAQDLYQRLQARHRRLKPLLLDQSFLAGLGNIYTDEALHKAGLHPLEMSDKLTENHAERLWRSIRQVLQEGIRHNGASIDWVYRGGNFQNHFRVYRQTGKPCPNCGAPIQKITVGQRGTHFCPQCQPLMP